MLNNTISFFFFPSVAGQPNIFGAFLCYIIFYILPFLAGVLARGKQMLDISPEVPSQNLLIPEVRKNSSTSPEFLFKDLFQDPAVSCKSGLARGAVREKAPPSLCLTSLVSQRNNTSLSSTLIDSSAYCCRQGVHFGPCPHMVSV